MRHFTKLVFISLFLLPVIAYGQFYGGSQDKTYWTADSGYVSGSADTLVNDNTGITNDQSITGNDQSINANTGNGTCQINLISGKRTIGSYVTYFGCIVRVSILPVIFTLAVVSFVWGVVTMITNSSNEEAQTKGKQFILTGIIGLFVMFSMYALVNIIRRTAGFGFNAKDDPTQYVQLKDKVLRNK